jgi:hypothetical protein
MFYAVRGAVLVSVVTVVVASAGCFRMGFEESPLESGHHDAVADAAVDVTTPIDLSAGDRGRLDALIDLAGPADLPGTDLLLTPDLQVDAMVNGKGAHVWSHALGGSSQDIGYAIARGAGGMLFATGSFEGSMTVGPTALAAANASDAYLVSFDAAGGVRWAKGFGGNSFDQGIALAVDAAGNLYVIGEFWTSINLGGQTLASSGGNSFDTFLAKFDAQGKHLWSKRFGGASSDRGWGLALDAANNIYIHGCTASLSIDLGGGALVGPTGWDVFLASYDTTGKHRWSKRFGGVDTENGHAVAVDAKGNLYISGEFRDTTTLGGAPLVGAGGLDVYVASYTSATGAHRWSRRFGGTGNEYGYDVEANGAGNLCVAGYFGATVSFGGASFTSSGNSDAFIARYDDKGAHVWSKALGGSSGDRGYAAGIDPAGNCYVLGTLVGSADLGGGPVAGPGFIAAYDVKGGHRWSKGFNGTGRGLTVAGGELLATGSFSGTTSFGGPTLSSNGVDIFLVKLKP